MAEDKGGGGSSAARKSMYDQHATHIIVSMTVATFVLGTVVYHILEDWSWVDSFYFSVVALTTVGFGDFSPTTDASKLFTVFYILTGVSLVGLVLNEFMKRRGENAAQRVVAKSADDDSGS